MTQTSRTQPNTKRLNNLELLQRMLYREFLTEPNLYIKARLEHLPEKLAKLLGVEPENAINELMKDPFLERLSLNQLKDLLTIRDMTLISRTAANVAAELKQPSVPYEECCRVALCFALADMPAHVLSALRIAGIKNDSLGRHHFLYGLVLGLSGDDDLAQQELEMALEREPYEDMRILIRQALDALDVPVLAN